MIEIVERATCPTCDGKKLTKTQSFTGSTVSMGPGTTYVGPCSECHGEGTVPRVLATFADVAALRAAFDDAYLTVGPYAHLAMEVLGVTNEPQ